MSEFQGDKKVGQSVLGKWEKKIIAWLTPKVPQWISSEALTYATLPICGFIILFSFLAQANDHFLWGVSFMIFMQWLTDSLDGAVGRYRNSGLIRWGYYMDHFLDYIFLCSILIGYSLILPDNFKYLLFFILAIMGAFMVHAYLRFGALGEMKIHFLGIGPTEIRILFIIVNTLLIIFGKTYLAFAMPYALVFCVVGLCVVVARTGKHIYGIDMQNRKINK